jgi:histidinol phosphatase-like PHP family hydrolase
MDSNLKVVGLLRDLSNVQTSKEKKWAYKRAAAAVMDLTVSLDSLRNPDGTLRKIPQVGPSCGRVILEVLDTGTSATADKAIMASPKAAEILERRQWQQEFLSFAQVIAANEPGAAGKGVVRLADCRADFQMHSIWSDGSESLKAMAEGCLARSYTHCVMTDHSHGLRIARGMSMDDLRRQHEEIDQVNRGFAKRFRIIKGIEANIGPDGALDVSEEESAALEFLVAAPHAALRLTTDQTDRMIAAVSHPHVRVLGHPRGRQFGSRPGISADWPRVFKLAAKRGVAIEIDGDPSRQDIDFTLARAAIAAGCVLALSSDAHSVPELRYIETAAAHARLAGVPRDRVINTWTVERLLDWARRGERTRRRI